MEKHSYTGKTFEEAVEAAKLELQEVEENLIINEKEVTKAGLFKSKKVEIEVIEKRELNKYLKTYLTKLLKDMGYTANIEMKLKNDVPNYIIYSDNDSLIIGKNGKNLVALTTVLNQVIKKETGKNYRVLVDVNDYKEKKEQRVERLAKKLAREVAATKTEVIMDSMNSYERRVVHNILSNNKRVYTESIGEEPDRKVVIKPKEDK